MRIALLSYEYPPETGFGGIGTYTWTQARALARLGHEVDVLCGARDGSCLRPAHHEGVRVWRHGDVWGESRAAELCRRLGLWWSHRRLVNGAVMADGLARLLARDALDVVEFPECGGEGMLLAGLAAGRSVVRFHSPAELILPFYETRRADRWLCARLERRAAASAARGISASRFLAERLCDERFPVGAEAPLTVIPNGVDLESADAPCVFDLRRALELPPGRRVVLFAGRLERRKGAEVWAEVAARLLRRQDVALVAIGRDLFGLHRRLVAPRLADGGGSYRHCDELPLAQVRAAMRQADVLVVPSLWENCPYVVLEGMAAQRPIVASAVGGIPELVEHERSALLVPSGDAGTTAAAVERLLDDGALAARLAEAARRRVATDFEAVAIARRSLEVYREVVG